MKKIYPKLIAMGILLSLSISVVAMASYAWMVLSSSPVVSGIQVAIGGGNTILVAPDMTAADPDGDILHYPGPFRDKMNFRQWDSYAYLQKIGTLMPVSTVNGVDWFLPSYYTSNDEEVVKGYASSGMLKPLSEFKMDSELSHANLVRDGGEEEDKMRQGHYAYLDFWVVSPNADFTLRIATGDESSGTFVIDLLEPVRSGDGYTLQYPKGTASSTVRIGFQANPYQLIDGSMEAYTQTTAFDDRFTSLRGMYPEPNSGTAYFDEQTFIIYEPNANSHPHDADLDGQYVITEPIGWVNGSAQTVNIREQVTAQNSSLWIKSETGYALEERFQTAIFNYKDQISSLSAEEIGNLFYNQYLQGQIYPYIDKAEFYPDTNTLYANAENPDAIKMSTVTEDAEIIDLQQGIPQRIRMFIWLEGQDVDCVDMASKCAFAVNIELAGGNIE